MLEGVIVVGQTKGPEEPAKDVTVGCKVTPARKSELRQLVKDYVAFKRSRDRNFPEMNFSAGMIRLLEIGEERWREEMSGAAPQPGRPAGNASGRDDGD